MLSFIRFTPPKLVAGLMGLVLCASSSVVQAEQYRITFENLQPTGGFSLTPAWVAVHDGTFDVFDPGAAASSELEAIAELGNTAPLSAAFNAASTGADATLGSVSGAGDPPILSPGESATGVLTTTAGNNFFSYASMVIPSNDTFIGNSNPALFDLSGLGINQSLTIDVTRFYDAGTEINDPANGAAFSTDGTTPPNGTGGADENGVITLDDFASFNAEFNGTNTPLGQITAPLGGIIGRFTITAVPEPGSVAFFGVLGIGMAMRRRRRQRC